tara:strand:+ start:9013 stop:10341 length:1329 start_codon:yes stop_codon:yes gene_type:complete
MAQEFKVGDRPTLIDQSGSWQHSQDGPFSNSNVKPGMWFEYTERNGRTGYKIVGIGATGKLTLYDSNIPGPNANLQIEMKDTFKKGILSTYGSGHYIETFKSITLIETSEIQQARIKAHEQKYKILKINTSPTKDTLRWPKDINGGVGSGTDYVLFQFGKYKAPFGNEGNPDNTNAYFQYQSSAALDEWVGNGIILPMPQDLGNESSSNWQGKTFTGIGRAAIAGAAGGNASFATSKLGQPLQNIKAITAALTAAGLNVLPGVGGNLSMNDITGSTQGIVLNPNAELLYDSPELREIGFTYKLVARNKDEADIIQRIIEEFRSHSLPSWGDQNNPATFTWDANEKNKDGNGKHEKQVMDGEGQGGDTFIHVPNLCHFLFMKGDAINPKLIQFKPCALANVSVNYTADGTYATYLDGAPVAVELGLKFQETKVIFRSDVRKGF